MIGIINQVEIHRRPTSSDIRRRIENAFERQADLDAAGVTIALDGSKVELGGRVKAWHERQVAERAAWAAPGVTEVEDHIVVA